MPLPRACDAGRTGRRRDVLIPVVKAAVVASPVQGGRVPVATSKVADGRFETVAATVVPVVAAVPEPVASTPIAPATPTAATPAAAVVSRRLWRPRSPRLPHLPFGPMVSDEGKLLRPVQKSFNIWDSG